MEHPFSQFVYCPKCGSNQFDAAGVKAKKCAGCGFVYYFNPSASTAGFVLNGNNELLVCRRAKDPAKGTLDLPGGFADSFETAEECMTREIHEETGLQIPTPTYLFSLPNIYIYSGFPVHTLDLFFLCQLPDSPPLKPADDVSECLFMPLSHIHPEQFGLNSVRQGVIKFLKDQNQTD